MSELIGRYGDAEYEATPYKDYEGSAHWTVSKKADFKEFGDAMPKQPDKEELKKQTERMQ